MPECQKGSESIDSRQVRFQLLRLISSPHNFFCFSWDFERSRVVGVMKEEYYSWMKEVPKARLVKRCECWLVKRIEMKDEKKVVRLESYGHCKRDRMTRSLNPLALAVGKIMVDYVFLFIEDEIESKEKLILEVERFISEDRLYYAQRKVGMLELVFGNDTDTCVSQIKEYKSQILEKKQIQQQKSNELKKIVQQELLLASTNKISQNINNTPNIVPNKPTPEQERAKETTDKDVIQHHILQDSQQQQQQQQYQYNNQISNEQIPVNSNPNNNEQLQSSKEQQSTKGKGQDKSVREEHKEELLDQQIVCEYFQKEQNEEDDEEEDDDDVWESMINTHSQNIPIIQLL